MTILLIPLFVADPIEATLYDPCEIVLVARETPANPFTDATLSADIEHVSGQRMTCAGFFDGDGKGDQEGSVYKIRLSLPKSGRWTYQTRSSLPSLDGQSGAIQCRGADRPGPVVISAAAPWHFVHAGSGRAYYPVGVTAYHLASPANDLDRIKDSIDAWRKLRINRVRLLLAGYPRDDDRRPAGEARAIPQGADPWRLPNYGAPPGTVRPLPTWLGEPHRFDFRRFRLSYWHKLDQVVHWLRESGIQASLIFMIEKQNLPREIGAGSDVEKLYYRYAVARLAAFDNVWWDLGNEHNEYRRPEWTAEMARLVKANDPYKRLLSVHAYADWVYGAADWADFIITQQSGSPAEVNAWALRYRSLKKPYVNEEYGYEGSLEAWGQGQSANRVRQSHWSIALAGGYATYGDWTKVAGFYSGRPDAGVAIGQLQHLLAFFERLPFSTMATDNGRVSAGFALTDGQSVLAGYLPAQPADAQRGLRVNLSGLNGPRELRWFDPRTGQWSAETILEASGSVDIERPSHDDWAYVIRPPVDED